MATFTDARKLAVSQHLRFGLVVKSWRAQTKVEAEGVASEMRSLLMGTLSTRELARRGHPFGRRKGRSTVITTVSGRRVKARRSAQRPHVPTPLLPINRQSGRLLRSLRVFPEHHGAVTSYRVQFTAPHAKWVLARGGTRKMVDRGFWQELKRRVEPRRKQAIYKMRLEQLRIMHRAA